MTEYLFTFEKFKYYIKFYPESLSFVLFWLFCFAWQGKLNQVQIFHLTHFNRNMQRPKLPVESIYPHEKNPQDVNYK